MSLDSLVISFFLIQRKPVDQKRQRVDRAQTSVTFPHVTAITGLACANAQGAAPCRVGWLFVPLVNIKIAGKWMFIPLKMVLIGIDPYPFPLPIILIEVQETTVKTCQNDCLLQLFVTVSHC